ncbi:site-specific DNA-methyltransferase [Burkholderia pseudomallei]|uniref:site-specific DNA-methyltransferase n=1 Tax=Burkholderia pseudomallei TaxID=28450 RepID=UPI000F0618BD|nr:site-specific DNA-methyltransferase [Burkholderia pseudomallei]MBO7803331.1 site-specific DNA-methyltransferase [Burkholderia pseudomallei]VCS85263.1 type III restriction-modification system methylation subunit [Burkholderia pseudomallei]
MSTKQNAKFQELVAKLREIFQIDRPELDFGIYRILNARAGEINDYLENRLAEKVQAALAAGNTASAQQLQAELQEAEKNAHALGVSPDGVPKVLELRARLKEATIGASEHENAVFSHLLAFFSRYYDNGDFISQRRYKGDTYAIPYAGEEVMLYWANKDQYYTKSGENFANYSFKLEDGRIVHFRLVAADTAKDNRKNNDKERRFALIEKKTVTRLDEEGDEYEEELLPVEEVDIASGKELIVRFEYTAQPKGTKQEALVTKAVGTVLADAAVKARWLSLGNRAPTGKNPQRTLLEKHLTDYTTKNTADYFIHKDLGGFLRRELDFYIKNEVMRLDDVQSAGAFADIEKNLGMIQCLRAIALELIAFLAQLEDFQKKLWLKKKFVVSSHYCITLDRVPEALWPEVVANEQQWARWKQLGVWDSDVPGTMEDLQAAPYRMVDTSLFLADFKTSLLNQLTDIDATLNGVLVHGDNFQGLGTLQSKHFGNVDCIYIDPPYNTDASAISYKNGYKSSSWASLMYSRISRSRDLLTQDGVLVAAIDDAQQRELSFILSGIFDNRILGTVTVRSNPSGRPTQSGYAVSHEYLIFAGATSESVIGRLPPTTDQMARFNQRDEDGVFEWRNLRREGSNSDRSARRALYYPIYIDGDEIRVPEMLWDEVSESWVDIEPPKDGEQVVFPNNDDGIEKTWRWEGKTVMTSLKSLAVRKDRSGKDYIYYKRRPNEDGVVSVSSWFDAKHSSTEHGTALLKHLFGGNVFSYPKSIHAVVDAIYIAGASKTDALVLDYFGGSGTTAHATITLNRRDGGERQYLLVEQGEYFDTVLKPRLQKVVFSAEWENGRPTAPDTGISHCFKVLKIESYEDTLNNLQLRRSSAQGDLLNSLPELAKDDYLLRYMLDVESRGSLLSVEDFKKPFDYMLNVAIDSAGAYEPRKIDLVETFNYLIGLRIKHIDAQPERGFVTVTGMLPGGETCLVLWRDCEVLDYEGINKVCDKLDINPADNEFDVVYINGDHNIPTVLTQTQEEGGATRVLKLRQIEQEFLSRMFSVEDI